MVLALLTHGQILFSHVHNICLKMPNPNFCDDMLSINTIARVILNVMHSSSQPTSFDTGALLVKDASYAAAKRLRSYANSAEAALTLAGSLESVVITVNVRV